MSDIFQKLNKLGKQFESDNQEVPSQLQDWAKDAKEATIFVHLLQFDGMKKFLSLLQADLENINSKLAGDRAMTQEERQYYFGIKDKCYEIIKFFESKEKLLLSLEEKVNEELS